MLIPQLALAAGNRWKSYLAKPAGRDRLMESAKTIPEGVQQRQNRINRLDRVASSERARAMVLAAETSPRSVASQNETIRTIGLERVIGTRDLMDVNFLELAIAIARAVGRLESSNEFGTGFLVGPRLLMTNHHVIESADAAGGWAFQLDYQQNAQGQMLPIQSYRVDPGLFFLSDEKLDFTIVGVQEVSDHQQPLSAYPWVKLIADLGKIETGDPVNIIQHPRGGLKQIAIRKNEVIALTNEEPDFLAYTTDTEPGSSGSPCFNDQWELVALHHQGVPKIKPPNQILKKDGQPWHQGDSDDDIDWIGNEGARVSAIAKALKGADLDVNRSKLREQMLSMSPPNPVELARAIAPEPDASGAATRSSLTNPDASTTRTTGDVMPASGTSFQIPLVITLSLGQPQAAAGASEQPQTGQAADLTEAVVIDKNYKNRPGYQPEFLDVTIPLPNLSQAQEQLTAVVRPEYRKDGNQFELRYWNYSVYMNKQRRTAWFSAANVDGDERFQLPPRSGDRWFSDPRIDASAQLDQSAFEPGIDRGHLTRREDAAWGGSKSMAIKSSNDTFHFTNCSLQASPFNRGKDRWQGLEQFLLEQHAKPEKRRMLVFTGPVFVNTDPTYRNDKMSYSVKCPMQFWKVCVLVRSDDSLSSTGFVLGQQDISELPGFEAFDVGAAQITLEQLEEKTGLDFGDLKEHDHFAQTGDVGTLEKMVRGGKQRFLQSYTDIVV